MLPEEVTGELSIGGYCIVAVGGVISQDPLPVTVVEVTRPNVPLPCEAAAESDVPMIPVPVPPLLQVIAGLGALPLP
jgi:hypothetical protein